MTRSHHKNPAEGETRDGMKPGTGRRDGSADGPQHSDPDENDVVGETMAPELVQGEPGQGVVDPVVQEVTSELESLRDRHLRLAAEYENYRKRTSRERSETWSRAQAEVVSGILDALDDLGRVLEIDSSAASTQDVIKGVEMVERKLVRELGNAGLERVGQAGEPFDPNQHEAIGSIPAMSAEEDHTVGSVLQVGYRFGGTLLRPAKVQVRIWDGADAGSHA